MLKTYLPKFLFAWLLSGVTVSGRLNAAALPEAARKHWTAETFRWVNLIRGDMMFMSLTNHRYLATQPNSPGQVTVTSTGLTPARTRRRMFQMEISRINITVGDSFVFHPCHPWLK